MLCTQLTQGGQVLPSASVVLAFVRLIAPNEMKRAPLCWVSPTRLQASRLFGSWTQQMVTASLR